MIYFKLKNYTKWDETDRLKDMTDANILAEKKKKNPSRFEDAVDWGLKGAAGGAALGLLRGGLGGAARWAKVGALGGAISGAVLKNKKKREENEFYNDRLDYAQRQARRREKKNWKTNMTQREGYSY